VSYLFFARYAVTNCTIYVRKRSCGLSFFLACQHLEGFLHKLAICIIVVKASRRLILEPKASALDSRVSRRRLGEF
jgi:hypothetical protein